MERDDGDAACGRATDEVSSYQRKCFSFSLPRVVIVLMDNSLRNRCLGDSSLNSTIAELPGSGGGAGGDAPDAQASALGLPHGQPQPPRAFPHHGIQRITVEFSEKSPVWSLM